MINWKKVKSNIPTNFKIKNGVKYETVYIGELDAGATVGEARLDDKLIVLSSKMSPKQTVSTFYHELIHVISHEYNADLTEKQVLAIEASISYLLPLIWSLKP